MLPEMMDLWMALALLLNFFAVLLAVARRYVLIWGAIGAAAAILLALIYLLIFYR
jgi:hypothetical protein